MKHSSRIWTRRKPSPFSYTVRVFVKASDPICLVVLGHVFRLTQWSIVIAKLCARGEKTFSFKSPNGRRHTLLLNRPLGISRFRLFQRVFVNFLPQIHLATCTKFPVQCTNKCGVRDIPREMVRCFFSRISNYSTTIDGSSPWYQPFVRLILLFTGHFRVPKPRFESEAESWNLSC